MLTKSEAHKIITMQQALDEKARVEIAKPFADAMLDKIGVTLAFMPYEQWLEIAKAAYRKTQAEMPAAGHAYATLHRGE